MPFASINSTNPRNNPWNFHEKILRIGGAGKWDFFEAAILNFLSRPFWIFFCFISVKNPALLYEVSFFSALWMVFPESWKRSCPNFYAHDCTQRKLLNFENWVNGEVSKIRRHFRNKSCSILKLSKNVNNKKCAPKLIFFNKSKIEKDSDNFWHRKLTLKVKFWHFFDISPLTQFSKFNNFLWVCWFLGKNLSNFVPPTWKLYNPNCLTG